MNDTISAEAPTDTTTKAKMATTDEKSAFTPAESRLIHLAFKHMKATPEIDWVTLAEEYGYANHRVARSKYVAAMTKYKNAEDGTPTTPKTRSPTKGGARKAKAIGEPPVGDGTDVAANTSSPVKGAARKRKANDEPTAENGEHAAEEGEITAGNGTIVLTATSTPTKAPARKRKPKGTTTAGNEEPITGEGTDAADKTSSPAKGGRKPKVAGEPAAKRVRKPKPKSEPVVEVADDDEEKMAPAKAEQGEVNEKVKAEFDVGSDTIVLKQENNGLETESVGEEV